MWTPRGHQSGHQNRHRNDTIEFIRRIRFGVQVALLPEEKIAFTESRSVPPAVGRTVYIVEPRSSVVALIRRKKKQPAILQSALRLFACKISPSKSTPTSCLCSHLLRQRQKSCSGLFGKRGHVILYCYAAFFCRPVFLASDLFGFFSSARLLRRASIMLTTFDFAGSGSGAGSGFPFRFASTSFLTAAS